MDSESERSNVFSVLIFEIESHGWFTFVYLIYWRAESKMSPCKPALTAGNLNVEVNVDEVKRGGKKI